MWLIRANAIVSPLARCPSKFAQIRWDHGNMRTFVCMLNAKEGLHALQSNLASFLWASAKSQAACRKDAIRAPRQLH
eukprot:scaffold75116_cov18-Tisochrysis_lutea.AAC.1